MEGKEVSIEVDLWQPSHPLGREGAGAGGGRGGGGGGGEARVGVGGAGVTGGETRGGARVVDRETHRQRKKK